TEASSVSGYVRSTSRPLTTAASAALARPGEIWAARSPTDRPAGTVRLEPSGSVTVIWGIDGSSSWDPAGARLAMSGRPGAPGGRRDASRMVGTGGLEPPTS